MSKKRREIELLERKSIDSVGELEEILSDERRKPKATNTSRQAKSLSPYRPIYIDGSNVANYNARGYPSFKNIVMTVEKCANDGYRPITVICDANLRYLLKEHEGVDDLDSCECRFCVASASQRLPMETVGEETRVHFLECVPKTDADVEILHSASLEGAQIVTNDNYNEYRDQYSLLDTPKWQVRFSISPSGEVTLSANKQ